MDRELELTICSGSLDETKFFVWFTSFKKKKRERENVYIPLLNKYSLRNISLSLSLTAALHQDYCWIFRGLRGIRVSSQT